MKVTLSDDETMVLDITAVRGAAPEMYHALYGLLSMLGKEYTGNPKIEAAYAALNKAEEGSEIE